MPAVTLGNVTLHYEDQGSGTPVLFIHGVWMSSRFFTPQLDGLSDRCRVLSLDMRAHGQSAHVHSGHTVAQYARDVHAFIEHMGLSEVVLAGWSMGAFVIWEYIKEYEGK